MEIGRMEPEWQFDESRPLTHEQALEATIRDRRFGPAAEAPLNAVLREVRIHDTRRWFNLRAFVRLDALVVTPAPDAEQIYHAQTFGFPGVHDGDTLAIEPEAGLGFYTGRPAYLLDVAVIASQGQPGQPTLAELLADSVDRLSDFLGRISPLLAAAPPAAAISGAAAAAASLSGAALRLLDNVTGKSIGLHRVTWYEHRDRFGIGRHPADGAYRYQDLGFSYEIFQDLPGGPG